MSGAGWGKIKRGLGKFTPRRWDQIGETVTWTDENRARLERAAEKLPTAQWTPTQIAQRTGVVVGQIYGYEQITEAIPRWRYKWIRVVFVEVAGANGYQIDDPALPSPADNPILYAYNLCEWQNSLTFAGPNYDLVRLRNAGFDVKPIAVGQLVEITIESSRAINDLVIGRFSVANAIDGECQQ